MRRTGLGNDFAFAVGDLAPARGDLFCRVVVETPVNLTREQKDLLQKFEDSLQKSGKHHHPREETWLDGVKRFFTSLGE